MVQCNSQACFLTSVQVDGAKMDTLGLLLYQLHSEKRR